MPVEVTCERTDTGWACRVTVGDDAGATTHLVTVRPETLAELRPGAEDPTVLVRRSFEFLLTREARESILARFDLEVIGRYFPEWRRAIQ